MTKKTLSERLNRRIVIEAPLRTEDGAGGYSESWQVLAHLWAEIKPLRGREVLENDQVQAQQQVQITIRYRTDITENMRILHGTETYNILTIRNPSITNQMLEIVATGY